ncbi:MAG TPA: hypothetical protein VIY49_10750 [Bryobacteraceae bacterium]
MASTEGWLDTSSAASYKNGAPFTGFIAFLQVWPIPARALEGSMDLRALTKILR